MGDLSHEPSMEEILSSIKKIISEDSGRPNSGPRARRSNVVESVATADETINTSPQAPMIDVLELTEAVSLAETEPQNSVANSPETPLGTPEQTSAEDVHEHDAAALVQTVSRREQPKAKIMLDQNTLASSRASLAQIAASKPKTPEAAVDSLQVLVSDLLRPMLKDWLDTNLPRVVETMVAKEIARLRDE